MNTEQKMELLRQKCSNCKWFKDGWCLDMDIHVNPNSLCVSWKEKEKDYAPEDYMVRSWKGEGRCIT